MMHWSAGGVLLHDRVASTQTSVVHEMPSSQRLPAPPQLPAPSQRSLAVQKSPSSQTVPSGASGYVQLPVGEQTSLVQASVSAHVAHIPPPRPHAAAARPDTQRVPFQQPAQHEPPRHRPASPRGVMHAPSSATPTHGSV